MVLEVKTVKWGLPYTCWIHEIGLLHFLILQSFGKEKREMESSSFIVAIFVGHWLFNKAVMNVLCA